MYLGDLHEEHVVPKPRKRGSRVSIAVSILLTFVIICVYHQLLEPVNQASIHASRSLQLDPHGRHPDKAVAVVQYDNPDRISLLDCYLKRDLTTNNGPLSSVIFFAHADISPSDSHALDNLVASSPHYSRFNTSTIPSPNFRTLLPPIAEESTLYITIPSTTVYLRPHAFTHLITSKLLHPTQRLTIANSITARHHHVSTTPNPAALTPSYPRQRIGSQTLRTISNTLLNDAENMTSPRASASVRGYLSLQSLLAAPSHPPAQPPHQHDKIDPSEGSNDARLHTAFMSSLALGRLDQWVRRSHPIAPPSPVDATSAMWEVNVAAVWGADVLDTGEQSVWEGEAWMDGMAIVALLDGTSVASLLERWEKYAGAMVCPPSFKEEEGVEL